MIGKGIYRIYNEISIDIKQIHNNFLGDKRMNQAVHNKSVSFIENQTSKIDIVVTGKVRV